MDQTTGAGHRLSCTYCNSLRIDELRQRRGGKQHAFPVFSETTRASTPSDCLAREDYCLLDPATASDPGLLWFREDGQAVAKYPAHVRFRHRAETSIELYHLNYFRTTASRRRIFGRVRDLVKDGQFYFSFLEEGDHAAAYAFKRVVTELMEMISPEAEYSAAARAYLQGLDDEDHPWICSVLTTS